MTNHNTASLKRTSSGTARVSVLTFVMLLMQSNTALAAPNAIPVAQLINNIANSEYTVYDQAGVTQSVVSNTVSVTASELSQYGITLTKPPRQTVAPGDTVTWLNTLNSISYNDQTVDLTLTVPKSLSNIKVYIDLNNNGIIDAGDELLILSGLKAQLALKQGQSIPLIIQATTDSNAQDGNTAEVQINATVVEDPSVSVDTAADQLIIIENDIGFKDDSFGSSLKTSQVGKEVFIEAGFSQCNFNASDKNYAWITVTSAKTKDSYTLKAIETDVNTGKYRVQLPTQNNANAVQDNIIQTLDGDTLTATLDSCTHPETGNQITPSDDIRTDILMTDNTPSLQVTKEGNVKSAEFGDYVNYTINVKNNGKATAYDVELKDVLPRGFSYVPSSMRVDSAKADDFEPKGKYQTLSLGTLTPGSSKNISYRVLIGSSSLGGDGINRATAEGQDEQGNMLSSLEAQWAIDVDRGVMNTDGIIIGKVYHDINRDGIQQKQDGELGVAGVRIYMENGNFIVTDGEGKYNFYGISAKTQVLKVDETTIPAATELVTQSSRNTGDPASRFVDLKFGELHRADFAIVGGMGDSPERLNKELVRRSESIGVQNDTLEKAIKNKLDLEPNYAKEVSNSVEASGCKSNDDLDLGLKCDSAIVNKMYEQSATHSDLTSDTASNRVDMVVNTVQQPTAKLLEEYLKDIANNDVRFINLNPNQQLSSHKQLIQVQAPLGSNFTLFVNDKAVPESNIGKTAEQEKQQVVAFDYYGVNLKRGRNTLRGVATDITGKVISEQQIDVMTPDSLQSIEYRAQQQLVEADGVSEYQVVVRLNDIAQLNTGERTPYLASTPITLDTNIGRINLKDTNKDQAGTQVIVNGGEILIPVVAPSEPGEGELLISSGGKSVKVPLQFTAKLRPMIAVGIIEGSVSLKDFDSNNITDAQGAFEKELNNLSGSDDVSGRAAMFLKGKVRGDYLLTLAYDSDKKGERLFRDIEPGEYYPVYGDASAKGFDAQSTSKLYVRLDKGRSFAMYGDLQTDVTDDEGIKLGRYNRKLTGLKARFENNDTRITTFAAETSSSQRVNETRGLGISGPYPLANDFDAVLENSETIEVITRDAANPGVIVHSQRLTRFADYEVDPISRSLYLKAPIASQDIEGNPIYLRVSVEVDEGGDDYWVGGISAKQKLTDNVSIGGSYVHSDDPLNKEQLASINGVVKLSENLKLVAEYAKSEAANPNYDPSNQINPTALDATDEKGDAVRIELDYDNKDRTQAKAYYNKADDGFVTGASPLTAGRTESNVAITHTLKNKNTALKLEGVRSEVHQTDAKSEGVQASIEQRLSTNVVAEVGVRYYKQEGASSRHIQAAPDVKDLTDDTIFNDNIINQSALSGVNTLDKDIEGTTARARLTARLPKANNSLIFAEYEQDLSHSNRNATSVGGETALGNMGRLYARHDLINSLSGSYGLDDTDERQRTVFGFDANYMKDGKVYSEYRMRDSISAREAEAAIGLKNKWYVQQGLTVNTLFERIESIEGEKDSNATAAGIGVEYFAHKDYKVTGRFEQRWGESSDTRLGSAGIAYRYSDEVTLLAKDIYSKSTYSDGYRTVNRLQLGAAYRDSQSNQLDMLSKIEYRMDENQTGGQPYDKDLVTWSWHGNYHPTRPLTLSGHYAGKYVQYKADSLESENTSHVAYVRGMYDINEKWDMGLQTGTYWNGEADDLTYMLGAEVGYSPITNLWLSVGYNFVGFEDDDIIYDDTTQEGAYFRMRFKFDEKLFKGKAYQ